MTFAPKVQSNTNIKVPDLGENKGSAVLFEGLGRAAIQAVGVVDEFNKSRIEKEAQDLFETANEPFADLADVPSAVKDTGSRFKRLRQAFDQGKLSDTAYYSQLAAGVKKIKAKYPSYGNEIDSTVQRVTGVRPANALRNAMLQELEASEQTATREERDWQEFISRQGNMRAIGSKFPDVFSNPEAYADPAERARVKSAVLEYNGQLGQFEMIRQRYATDEAAFKANREIIERQQNTYISSRIRDDISGLNATLEKQYGGNLYTTLGRLTDGSLKLGPEELQQFIGSVQLRRNSLYSTLQLELSENSNGFAAASDIKKQLDAAMQPYDSILTSLQSGDWDIAGASARALKHMQENDLLSLTKGSNDIRIFSNLKNLSPDLAEAWLRTETGGQFIAGIDGTATSILIDNLNSEEVTLSEELKAISGSDKLNAAQKSGTVNKSLESLKIILSDPKVKADKFESLVEKVYSRDSNIYQTIADDDHLKVFTTLTNPKITERVLASGDPRLINQYKSWTIAQLHQLSDIRKLAGDVNSISSVQQFLDAEIDETGKLQVYVDENAFSAFLDNNIGGLAGDNALREIGNSIQNISDMNSVLSSVIPILEGTGDNSQDSVKQIIGQLGVDLTASSESWLSWIAQGIDQTVPIATNDEGVKEEQRKTLQNFINTRPDLVRKIQDKPATLDERLGFSFEQGDRKGASIANRLATDLGITPAAAAGIAGNLAHESGNFRTLQEIKPLVKGSRGGFGWAQWTGPRRRAFERFAAQHNLSVSSDEANYRFLLHELMNTSERRVLKKLQGVTDPAEAARIFSNTFLRPGIPHMNSRIRFAQKIAQG